MLNKKVEEKWKEKKKSTEAKTKRNAKENVLVSFKFFAIKKMWLFNVNVLETLEAAPRQKGNAMKNVN